MDRYSDEILPRSVSSLADRFSDVKISHRRFVVKISQIGKTLCQTPQLSLEISDWWAHWDSNPEPKDYAYHFGFRRGRAGGVCGLDHAFTVLHGMESRWVIMVSTPSRLFGFGSALGRIARSFR